MLILVIAVSAAMVLYSSILILFSDTPRQRIKTRLNKLAENVELEYIHDAVLNEKKKRRKIRAKPRLVSRRFEDTLAMAGIHISAQEFMALWCCLTLGPVLRDCCWGWIWWPFWVFAWWASPSLPLWCSAPGTNSSSCSTSSWANR